MDKYQIIYDNKCPICTRAVNEIAKLDLDNKISLIPLESADALKNSTNILSIDNLRNEIHLITPDNKILKGIRALAVIGSLLPRYRFLGYILQIPLISPFADIIYRFVARYRFQISSFFNKK